MEAGRQLIRRQRPSAIFATVPPYANAVAGALLSIETGVPLVTDFRDPWTRIDTVWVIPNKLLRWVSGLIERVVLRTSSAIVMADEAEYAQDFFVECNSKTTHKLFSILNGYDSEDFSAVHVSSAPSKGTKFAVSYVGSFYDEPTFMNVKRAFDQWQERYPAELEEVEFHYAGSHSRIFDQFDFRPHYLHDHGYVSHRESIAIRASSDIQVFSQPPSFKAHVISGKIYEMMRIPVPILAITNPSGTVARFLQQTGTGLVVDNRDPHAATHALRESYLAWKSGRSILVRNEREIAAFSRENQAKQLSELLERLIQVLPRGNDLRG